MKSAEYGDLRGSSIAGGCGVGLGLGVSTEDVCEREREVEVEVEEGVSGVELLWDIGLE